MNLVLRSALFMLLMVLVTPPLALYTMLHFPFSPLSRQRAVLPWVHTAAWCVEHVLGIRYRVLGREHIPAGPALILSKHQSAWETIFLQLIFPRVIFVWKREILFLPFFGWALAVHPSIAINRSAGAKSMRQLFERGNLRLAQGFSIVIFPEGTRTPPGSSRPYKLGGSRLAVASNALIVPVALNSGVYWGRQAFLKRPGCVTVSIGKPFTPNGMSPEAVTQHVQTWIEAEMQRISTLDSDAQLAAPPLAT